VEHTPDLRPSFRMSGPSMAKIASDGSIFLVRLFLLQGQQYHSFLWSVVDFSYGYNNIHWSIVSFLAIIPIPKVYIFFSDSMKLLMLRQISDLAANEISKRLGSLGELPGLTWVGILISPRQCADTNTDTLSFTKSIQRHM
jgi:hypothetical protein